MGLSQLLRRRSPVVIRMGDKLRKDASREARRTGATVSELIREGLRLRLYGNRNLNRARRAA